MANEVVLHLALGVGGLAAPVAWIVYCARRRRCPFCNETHGGPR